MFENLCRDSVGSSAFVVLQPCNGLPKFRVKWRRVQVLGWWQVWQIIQDMWVSRVGVVKETLKMICPTGKNLVTVFEERGPVS